MKEEEIIRKLGERLRDAEAPVDPAIWEGISQALPAAGAGGAAAGAASSGLSASSWVAIAVVSAGLIGGTVWLTSEDTPSEQPQPTEQTQVKTTEEQASTDITNEPVHVEQSSSDATKAADDAVSDPAESAPSTQSENPAPQREVVQQIASDPAADTILWESVEEARQTEPVTTPGVQEQPDASSAFAEQKEDSNTAETDEADDLILPAFTITPDLNDPMSFTFALAAADGAGMKNLASVEWLISDGGSAEGTLADYTFYDEGTYTVTLRAVDTDGNIHSQEREIEAYLPARLELPNVFTPNGDGVNDRLTIGERSRKIEIEYLAVYDSNGTMYYEQHGSGLGWNGRDLSGNEAPEGNYILVVKAVSERGQLFNERRVVRLER
jgi:gliding motility-associated-like protein